MKRAQVQSFSVYLTVLIVAVVLLILGYQGIKYMDARAAQVQSIRVQSELQKMVRFVGEEAGRVRVERLVVPEGFEEMCLADLSHREDSLKSPALDAYPMMKDSLKTGAKQNVFFVSRSSELPLFGGDIRVEGYPYFTCLESADGIVQITLEGEEGGALVSHEVIPSLKVGSTAEGSQVVRSVDGMVELEILDKTRLEMITPEGSIVKSKQPDSFEISIDPTVNPLKEGTFQVMGEIYSMGPAGVSFSPPAKLRIRFDSRLVPERLERIMKIAYYDGQMWVFLPTDVDMVSDTLTTEVNHFSEYAVGVDKRESRGIKIPDKAAAMNKLYYWLVGVMMLVLMVGGFLIFTHGRQSPPQGPVQLRFREDSQGYPQYPSYGQDPYGRG